LAFSLRHHRLPRPASRLRPSNAPPRRLPRTSRLGARRHRAPDRKRVSQRRRLGRRHAALAREQRLGHRRGDCHRIRDPRRRRHRRLGQHPPAQAEKGACAARHRSHHTGSTAAAVKATRVARLVDLLGRVCSARVPTGRRREGQASQERPQV
ncbi:uncharacterized protein B0H18DRAFT_1214627, partial [Fomitopsis serialis]|uniref:uncharacterized protein n=1 Tax=Fomitopsis serialis TaxID=139415 RepID=UPI002007EFFF